MIILDVETTGLDPFKNSLVSIAAIDFNNPEERFYEECRIWEGAEVNLKALIVNGLSKEELHDSLKKTESDIVKNFIDWVKLREDKTIAGQNPSFDIAFIKASAIRAGVTSNLPFRSIDIHTLAWHHMKGKGLVPPIKDKKSALESDEIMRYVGLPEEPKPHVGMNGALWEFEAMYRLLYATNKLEEFEKYPINFNS